jgi:hypothetical protein
MPKVLWNETNFQGARPDAMEPTVRCYVECKLCRKCHTNVLPLAIVCQDIVCSYLQGLGLGTIGVRTVCSANGMDFMGAFSFFDKNKLLHFQLLFSLFALDLSARPE